MTDSMSGFLSPEERAALVQRGQAAKPETPSDVSLAILQTLATDGPTKLSELLPRVHARPRMVMYVIDELEQSGLVRVTAQDVEEIAELTENGRRTIAS